jgi:hypothetical protein
MDLGVLLSVFYPDILQLWNEDYSSKYLVELLLGQNELTYKALSIVPVTQLVPIKY